MGIKNKLNKKQVFSIPKLLRKKTIGEVAEDYKVSWQAVWYWIGRLKKSGMKIETRKKGSVSKIL